MIDIVSHAIVDHYAEVRKSAQKAEEIVQVVVQRYAGDLDEFVNNAETYLNKVRDSESQQFDFGSLERMCIRLPILLYRVCEGLDRSAMDSDVAKAAVELVKAQNYLAAPEGTIPEKKSWAELKTADEAAVVDLTKHVHARLKNKIEYATALFDGVRKVMSAHESEKQIFGRSKP